MPQEVTIDSQARLTDISGQAFGHINRGGRVMRHLQRQRDASLWVGQHEVRAGAECDERLVTGRAARPASGDRPAEQRRSVLDRLARDPQHGLGCVTALIGNRRRHQERRHGGHFADRHLVGDSVAVQVVRRGEQGSGVRFHGPRHAGGVRRARAEGRRNLPYRQALYRRRPGLRAGRGSELPRRRLGLLVWR